MSPLTAVIGGGGGMQGLDKTNLYTLDNWDYSLCVRLAFVSFAKVPMPPPPPPITEVHLLMTLVVHCTLPGAG